MALLGFLVYLPALRAGFIWDDDALTANPLMGSLSGLWRIWTAPRLMTGEQHYWPLVYASFWLEHLFVGLHPFFYHLDNILLHCAATLLFWRVLLCLSVPGAWLAAALFAVHPVHAESVAWIIERKDVLSGALYFGSVLAFLSWDRMDSMDSMDEMDRRKKNGTAGPGTGMRRAFYFLSLGLFTAALLSKSIVVTLPVALALILWWRRGRLTRRDLRALAPFFLLAAALTLADLHFYHGQRGDGGSGLALPERILMAGRSLWVYLAKLAWPWSLATFYPQWPVSRAALASWLPLLAWLGLLAGLWFARRRIGRGPFAAVAFFSVTLAPVLGLIDFDFLHLSWIADRFQYLAAAAPLALAAAGLAQLARKFCWPSGVRRSAAAALLALPGFLCLRQASYYRDSLTLFDTSAAAYPRCWPAQFHRGWALGQAGRNAEALAALGEALRLAPHPEYHVTDEMAQMLELEQRFQEAEACYRQTLDLKPDFPEGHINYGAFLAGQGRLEEAVAEYRKGLNLNPNYSEGLNNLGNALRCLHRLGEAAESLARAVRQDPRRPVYRTNLAQVLSDLKRYPEALEQCQEALKLDPGHVPAYITIGQVLLTQGKSREAFTPLEQARRLQPQNAFIYYLTGVAHQLLGNAPEAARAYQEALRLQPDLPEVATRLKSLEGTALAPPQP